jgi:hypothetical protein
MLNEYYNQVTPSIKVSDLRQLRLDELRRVLEQEPTKDLDYLETMLDELGCNNPGDKGPLDDEFRAAYEVYGRVRRVALNILTDRRA